MDPNDEVTQILISLSEGDSRSSEKLLPLVYEELRRLAGRHMAREAANQTFQATELVHEAFLRLVGSQSQASWDSRGHFYAAAAEAMRRILIERARRKGRIRHGGKMKRVDLDDVKADTDRNPADILALDEALTKMEQEFPEHAALTKLRYFAGLSLDDAAQAMGKSRATAARYWQFSKAWLYDSIEGQKALDDERS